MKFCTVIAFSILGISPQGVFNTRTAHATSEKAESLEEYKSFVKDVGERITYLFADKNKSLNQRKEHFRSILENDFDISAIGKFVLARHWRKADPSQQQEFLNLFKEALVENYSKHFNDYHGEHLYIISARKTKDTGVIVQTQVKRPQGGEPLRVDWKVFSVKGSKRSVDLVINGASMSISLRTEYDALIQSKGGTMEGLLQALREKYKN